MGPGDGASAETMQTGVVRRLYGHRLEVPFRNDLNNMLGGFTWRERLVALRCLWDALERAPGGGFVDAEHLSDLRMYSALEVFRELRRAKGIAWGRGGMVAPWLPYRRDGRVPKQGRPLLDMVPVRYWPPGVRGMDLVRGLEAERRLVEERVRRRGTYVEAGWLRCELNRDLRELCATGAGVLGGDLSARAVANLLDYYGLARRAAKP